MGSRALLLISRTAAHAVHIWLGGGHYQQTSSASSTQGYLRLMSYWAAMLLVCLPLLLADSSRSRGLRSSSTSSNTKPPQYDGSVTQDIVRIYTKLKISMDYVKLATSSEKMSWFRSDITNWLRSVVSDPTYIQGTGMPAEWFRQQILGSHCATCFQLAVTRILCSNKELLGAGNRGGCQ